MRRVFAAHGIPLRQARSGPAPGVVKLLHHEVEVDVALGHGTERWISVSAADLRNAVLGNVTVTYPSSNTRAVKAALRSLHA